MGDTLKEIAEKIKKNKKKLQLIYAFNGVGKTRLSREFKELVAPKDSDTEGASIKFLYYNAFTEDLFYWDNDLNTDSVRKLRVQPNGFTDWILNDQGQANNIIAHFQRYTNNKLTPLFNQAYTIKDYNNEDITVKANSEITFSIAGGNENTIENIKISKGEESNLIWCVFYSLLEQVIEVLNEIEPADRQTNQFDNLEYVFIDDPVSSLDDNHLIELAVNVAELIKSSTSELKFIITTHNPLFYNVLCNEFNGIKNISRSRFDKLEDETYLMEDSKDSPFSYHLLLLSELEKATKTEEENIQKYHFNILRNLLEKTSTFLGYKNWRELLPSDSREAYYNRIINLYSHSKHSGEETSIVRDDDKRMLRYLVNQVIIPTYHFKSNITSQVNEQNETV